MNRRDFLKVGSLFSGALFIQASPIISQSKNITVELLKVGKVYFRGQAGEIQTSKDAGQTWQMHTRLGPEYLVTGLYLDRARRVRARVAFAGRTFELALARGQKYWRTV